MEREVETITDPAMKQVFGERVQILANKCLDDEEVLAVANGLLARLNLPTIQGKIPRRVVEPQKPQTPSGLRSHLP